MDLNSVLIFIVLISCLSLTIRALISRNNLGWALVSGLILAIAVVLLFLIPSIAGLVSGSFWGIFFLLPLIGFGRVNKLIFQQRFASAYKTANLVRWLHPFDGWWEYPEFIKALDLGQQGKMAEAHQLLNRHQSAKYGMSRHAVALLYLMEAQWQELLIWIEINVPEKVLFHDVNLTVYYLRSLGETGDLNKLLHSLDRATPKIEKTGNLVTLNLIRMFVLAFCGEVKEVEKLFDTSLAMYPQKNRQFWLATARMVAGNETAARSEFSGLRDRYSQDRILNSAIAWRLSHSPTHPQQVLTESSQQILTHIKSDIQHERKYSGNSFANQKKPLVTYGLISINLIFFLLEIYFGGSQNPRTLYFLGALVPQAVLQGQWWRVITANFLHYGALHLIMNMLGLYFFGPFVEFSLGSWRYLLCYFVSGVGTMSIITFIAQYQDFPFNLLVGASASIMGLIGVISAILLWGWRREKARIAGKRLRIFLIIIVLQIIFDRLIPQVSGLSHLLGLGLGFATSSLLLINWQLKE
ncbi:MAG: rhomboid family intramembrane serine protease [Oscillatoria sp. PMC 1051.18]|nr:rhomboid family intramembrane serine protease [Oscillatoria sp. PMC 1050.18]MEC5029803.1 rhomboid family intramembrane serine protease [Oscillatoria sp. PMC 1051.18]